MPAASRYRISRLMARRHQRITVASPRRLRLLVAQAAGRFSGMSLRRRVRVIGSQRRGPLPRRALKRMPSHQYPVAAAAYHLSGVFAELPEDATVSPCLTSERTVIDLLERHPRQERPRFIGETCRVASSLPTICGSATGVDRLAAPVAKAASAENAPDDAELDVLARAVCWSGAVGQRDGDPGSSRRAPDGERASSGVRYCCPGATSESVARSIPKAAGERGRAHDPLEWDLADPVPDLEAGEPLRKLAMRQLG